MTSQGGNRALASANPESRTEPEQTRIRKEEGHDGFKGCVGMTWEDAPRRPSERSADEDAPVTTRNQGPQRHLGQRVVCSAVARPGWRAPSIPRTDIASAWGAALPVTRGLGPMENWIPHHGSGCGCQRRMLCVGDTLFADTRRAGLLAGANTCAINAPGMYEVRDAAVVCWVLACFMAKNKRGSSCNELAKFIPSDLHPHRRGHAKRSSNHHQAMPVAPRVPSVPVLPCRSLVAFCLWLFGRNYGLSGCVSFFASTGAIRPQPCSWDHPMCDKGKTPWLTHTLGTCACSNLRLFRRDRAISWLQSSRHVVPRER